MNKKEKRHLNAQKRTEYIYRFAEEMGYETHVEEYHHCINGRPCIAIELIGTCDSEGNAYSWAWYTDTWEEF